MAMEKGAKQMQQRLMLLEAVTDANGQVRLTTQQQRSATAQVVETMEQLTDASRQVSATAQQIAAAAGNLADLAGNLETQPPRQPEAQVLTMADPCLSVAGSVRRRFAFRLVAAMLLVSVPLMVVAGVVVDHVASSSSLTLVGAGPGCKRSPGR